MWELRVESRRQSATEFHKIGLATEKKTEHAQPITYYSKIVSTTVGKNSTKGGWRKKWIKFSLSKSAIWKTWNWKHHLFAANANQYEILKVLKADVIDYGVDGKCDTETFWQQVYLLLNSQQM